MEIEIWSDVVCPFCYIGKRHLEIAIADLGMEKEVKIEWKSFQLDPNAKPAEGLSLHQYLADSKGMRMEEVISMSQNVEERANAIGLQFDLGQAIVANTQKAHQILHLAKKCGLQNELKERYLQAYFTEGRDLNDNGVLSSIAEEIGMDKTDVLSSLNSSSLIEDFQMDVKEAMQIGVRGVPFFVFNRKYAISGAQPIDTFKSALIQVQTEMKDTATCDVDDSNC